jgi:hypothetical protein
VAECQRQDTEKHCQHDHRELPAEEDHQVGEGAGRAGRVDERLHAAIEPARRGLAPVPLGEHAEDQNGHNGDSTCRAS